jgi:hypothetical protein
LSRTFGLLMSQKSASPLLGYNNNVRHKGKVFHVQTEDSGIRYGHIITHLFMDGGRILKSVKTSYAEYIPNDRRAEIVREMMKQQHKAMFIALRDGKFDAAIEAGGSGQAVLPMTTNTAQPILAAREASAQAATAAAAPASLVGDLLERAAAVANSPATCPADLPPPPPKLLRDNAPSGTHRTALPSASGPSLRAPAPVAASQNPVRGRSSAPAGGARRSDPVSVERRYAPTRPASVFGQARPQQGQSIFGEDLLSDKSLDEVILSYLAAELEGEKK